MFCKNCGAELKENAVVCLNCGVAVGDGDKFCPNCGAKPDPLASICVACGHQLKPVKGTVGGKKVAENVDYGTGFVGAIKTCFHKYVDFSGRARRSEYWWFYLLGVIASIPMMIGYVTMTENHPFYDDYGLYTPDEFYVGLVFYILGWIVDLALFLPSLAVLVRRLHDTGKSGWLWLIALIPIIGFIILLVFLVQDSDPNSNDYGECPK